MKAKYFLLPFIMLFATMTFSQTNIEEPAGFELIAGPRVGIGYIFVDPSEFTSKMNKRFDTHYDYIPFLTSFGASLEQRIPLGETKSHFAVQEIASVNGLEQSLILPVCSILAGYRNAGGLTAGVGPQLSIDGFQILLAIGWTMKYRGINIPFDISYIISNAKAASSITLTTGYNFIIKKETTSKRFLGTSELFNYR